MKSPMEKAYDKGFEDAKEAAAKVADKKSDEQNEIYAKATSTMKGVRHLGRAIIAVEIAADIRKLRPKTAA